MAESKPASRSPWFYIPALYFQQGLPVILVQQFSVILYKKLGVPNDQIGLWTSLIAWPWILKMLWGPWVDTRGTKRAWVFSMQLGVLALLAATAAFVTSPYFLAVTLALFFATAFFSATHDIALDGYYLLALRKDQQAFFMGIRSTFFRLAMIFCNGALVILAGAWERDGLPIAESWRRAILLGALTYGALSVFAFIVAPRLAQDGPVSRAGEGLGKSAFWSFFAQDKAWAIVAFILFYRFGESMLTKMSGPFLLDPRSAGGLGFDTLQVGSILGNVGTLSLVAGGLLGGILISRKGLRACFWPMVLLMNLPNLLYVWAARVQPGVGPMYVITAIEQFTYGFGMAPYMVFSMYVSQRSRFQTSHYAITTGLMALGAMAAGIASGFVQKSLGYTGFFVAVCLATIPGMLLLKVIPLSEPEREGTKAPEARPALAEA
ncbi:MAG: MFS transporter [Oligoflexia bacterium]|nr:MFS transporter [Oligoflexia bacterium]